MSRHSCDLEFWRAFASRYRERLDVLAKIVPNVIRVSADEVASGDGVALKSLVADLGLEWREDVGSGVDASIFDRN